MKQTHTPGPWTIKHRFNVFAGRRSVASTAGYQSNVDPDQTDAENEANARLIAAAPDLLAACQAVLKWSQTSELQPDGTGSFIYFAEDIVPAIAAIIAAATGDTTP